MRTLLLAESHAATRKHLEERLAQLDYVVRSAAKPEEALELFAVNGIDAVLLAADFPLHAGRSLPVHFAMSAVRPAVPLMVIDKAHLGRARGRQAILALKPHAYVEDPLKEDDLREKLAAVADAIAAAPMPQGASLTLSRSPVQQGELRQTDLPELFCNAFRLRRSGILVLAHGDAVAHVYFIDGVARAFASSRPEEAWPSSPDVPTPPLRAFPSPDALAQDEALAARWRDFVQERVAGRMGQRTGRFAFFAGEECRDQVPGADVPALGPVLEGARRAFRTQRFGHRLRPHLGKYPVRTASFSSDLRALGLVTADLKVAMQVNGRVTLRELLANGRGGLAQGYSLFWFLELCGALGFEAQPLPGKPGESEGLPERRRKPLPAELATQLREGGLKIITGSYFQVLGLDLFADRDAVEEAYREVAARFHPDTHAEYDIGPLKDMLESVQDKLTAAYRVLSVDEKRRAYLKFLFSRGASGRVSPVHLDAELAIRRGEAFLKRGDVRSALQAFQEAVALNPREPQYSAYLAWHTYRSGDGTPKDRAKAAEKLLKRALNLDPEGERLNVIRAILENESGDAGGARRRLLHVLEGNPRARLAKAALRRVGR